MEIARPHTDIHHARQPRPETRRKSALVKHHILHHVGIDGRDKPAQVLAIIKHRAIQHQHVLVIIASAHKNSCRAITRGLHARQLLQGFHHVEFAHKRGQAADLGAAYGVCAHLRGCGIQVYARRIHLYFLQVHARRERSAILRRSKTG